MASGRDRRITPLNHERSALSSDPLPASHRPIVDAHVHLLPNPVLEAVQEWFQREVSWTLPDVTTSDVVEFVDTSLDGAVCFPYAHEPGVARSMNRKTSEVVNQFEGVVGLATAHAGDSDPGDIVRDGLAIGLQGVKLHCPVQKFSPDDTRLDPIYELAVERGLPVVVHASSHPFYRGSELIGPALIERTLERFPRLRLCIPHLGLFETDQFFDLVERYDGLAFDTAVAVGDQIHELIGVRDGGFPLKRLREHVDRIMFGTDFPTYPHSVVYDELVSATASAFPAHCDEVFHQNAIEFYGIDSLSNK